MEGPGQSPCNAAGPKGVMVDGLGAMKELIFLLPVASRETLWMLRMPKLCMASKRGDTFTGTKSSWAAKWKALRSARAANSLSCPSVHSRRAQAGPRRQSRDPGYRERLSQEPEKSWGLARSTSVCSSAPPGCTTGSPGVTPPNRDLRKKQGPGFPSPGQLCPGEFTLWEPGAEP